MGDYSRDPRARLDDAVSKHYVGVRLQQGVPILDADWNELDGLHRHALEEVGTWFIGDGVPVGSDGFRILALPNGGVGLIVLTAEGATITVDVANSTAASELGFDVSNATAGALGYDPVQLVGRRAEPFALANGETLVVTVDGLSHTVTFQEGEDIEAIEAATAEEVAAVITSQIVNVTAEPTAGNDFLIRRGLCGVSGKVAKNAGDVLYSTQPLALEEAGDAPAPLSTPESARTDVVYLDVWEREVGPESDDALVDVRIGVETGRRLKRTWAVRVAEGAGEPDDVPDPPPGHAFYPLALLDRPAGTDAVEAAMIRDVRDLQVSVRRRIEARRPDGTLVVTDDRFRQLLQNTRDNVLDGLQHFLTDFNAPDASLVAGEVLGFQALERVARTADAALAMMGSQTIANQGALEILEQLYDAEDRFYQTWAAVVLDLGGSPKKYAAYNSFIDRLDARLHDASVGTFTGLRMALDAGNLEAATAMQEEIARLIGTVGAELPRGTLSIALTGVPNGPLTQGRVVTFEYTVQSFTTLADTYTVTVLPSEGWDRDVVDDSGTPLPSNRVSIGPRGSTVTIFVEVVVGTGTSDLQIQVVSDSNPTEVSQLTSLITLEEGEPAPGAETRIQLELNTVKGSPPPSGTIGLPTDNDSILQVDLSNNLSTQQQISLAFDTENAEGTWTTTIPGDATPNVSAGATIPISLVVNPSPGAGTAQLRLEASTTDNGETISTALVLPAEAT
jgi:hypothetical protein